MICYEVKEKFYLKNHKYNASLDGNDGWNEWIIFGQDHKNE